MKRDILLAAMLILPAVCLARAPDGAALYKKYCAGCHDVPKRSRVLDRAALKRLSPESILAAQTTGTMVPQATGLSIVERRALSEFLAGRPFSSEVVAKPGAGACQDTRGAFDPTTDVYWNGWGVDLTNSRFQPAAMARLTAKQTRHLKLKWAFGFPGANLAFAQPTIAGGRVFVGSATGRVYSLDATTGCTHWSFPASAGVRTAISIGPVAADHRGARRFAAYFGDVSANVYAVDASSGSLLWKTRVEDHKDAAITGAPLLHAGRLYAPVASGEEVRGGDRNYQCCRFRGSLVALDAQTGKQIWKAYTIPAEPKPTRRNKVGTQMWGPSGGGVWSAPTLDLKRRAVYVANGNAYSIPDAGTTDAVLAFGMHTGRMLWVRQIVTNDVFNLSCLTPDKANCAEPPGPDFDFANSPVLRVLPGGRRLLVVGQKSGVVYALDPDRKGEILWQARVSKGGALGGVMWGSAADGRFVYVAVSDVMGPPEEAGGLFALELATGKKLWASRVKPGCTGHRWCTPAQSAAVTLIPGVVFSGAIDGHLRAYSTADGSVVWDFDTAQEFKTVNQVKARGGSLDGPGPTVAGGMVFVNSGYARWQGKPGNVLLAFSVNGK